MKYVVYFDQLSGVVCTQNTPDIKRNTALQNKHMWKSGKSDISEYIKKLYTGSVSLG